MFCQNARSCVSSTTRMHHGALVNVHRRLTWKRRNCWKKVVIFVFFAYKKYSSSFIKLWLNQWCHMDYFNNVLTTFLGLERVRCVAETHTHTHTHRVRNLSDFIKNIIICVPKMNEGLGLEQHKGDRIFLFGWTIPLTAQKKARLNPLCIWPGCDGF